MFRANFRGVEMQGVSKLLSKGKYLAQIIKAEEKKTKTNGDPMVAVTYRVQDGESSAVVFENIVFMQSMFGRCMHFLHVIDEPYEGEVEVTPANWINRHLVIKVDIEEFDGKKRNVVKAHEAVVTELNVKGDSEVPF